MLEMTYKSFDMKILSIKCLITRMTKSHKMRKLNSSSYKDQIAMEFKTRGPYMVIRPLRKVCRFFLVTHPWKYRKRARTKLKIEKYLIN